MAAGNTHACALDEEGGVECWGSLTSAPEAGMRLISIEAAYGYACGLDDDGGAHCWGPRAGPKRGISNERFIALSAGFNHLCGLRDDGSVSCSGDQLYGQSSPPPGARFSAIAAGYRHTCGLNAAGEAQCWGVDPHAALSGKFESLSAGWRNTCGARPDGNVECWEHGDILASGIVNFDEAFNGRPFKQPVELFPWPTGGLAVVERAGYIAVFEEGQDPRTALDLIEAIGCCRGEDGMLGAALDPRFDEFPFLYVYYTIYHAASGSQRENILRLARFPLVDGYAVPEDEFVILELRSDVSLHNGGGLRFDPDGMLHLGIGTPGPPELAQDLGSLRGKIIRIDVRGASEEQPYRIPEDNPFANDPAARPEIWAYGLRNPWRMAFGEDGGLWISDVGLSAQEEVSIATAGANLGWPAFEGTRCRDEARCAALADAVAPVHAYGRDEGCAVVGGEFYAGGAIPRLRGAYLFGDYCKGTVWAAQREDESGWSVSEVGKAGRPLLSLGLDGNGEVYALTLGGPILRLAPTDADGAGGEGAKTPGDENGAGSGPAAPTGAQLYATNCAACHSLDAEEHGVGPHLVGVIGRRVGQTDGWDFSDAIRSLGGVWTRESLAEFLADPQEFAPGTTMGLQGLPGSDASAIADYIGGLLDE